MLSRTKLKELALKTPPSRDRFIDFVRAFSIVVVVIGHWMSILIVRSDTGVDFRNAVGAIPGMWALTWILQVMPLFFFVGGFSNFVTLRSFRKKGKSFGAFIRTRAIRLFKPTLIFLVIWLIPFLTIILFFREHVWLVKTSIVIISPLWFLAVYIGIVLFSPIMYWLHLRLRLLIPILLLMLVILVDLLRFAFGVPFIHWLNIAFVWFFIHQMGFFYADRSLLQAPRWLHAVMAIGGLAGLTILTNIGIYPRSMVGTGFEELSNMSPPTVCIIILTFWFIGLFLLLRDRLSRWLSGERPWMSVIAANTMIMTLYLWHLLAYAIAYIVLHPIGLGRGIENKALWWLERPIWIIIPALILAIFAAIFGRFEHVRKKQVRVGKRG
jgi:hypothetical protein